MPVTKMTFGRDSLMLFSRSKTSQPSMPGMSRSSNTMSTRPCATSRKPASPLETEITS